MADIFIYTYKNLKPGKCDRCGHNTTRAHGMFHADGFPLGGMTYMCISCCSDSFDQRATAHS